MRGKFGILACGVLCGVAALVLPAVAGAAGFGGPGYAGTSGPPTTSKPESKLWFNDGFWWASMFNKNRDAYTIHRLSRRTQRWVNTGVAIDFRDSTRQDALSLGSKLFIASHKYKATPTFDATPNADADGMRLYRFSYNSSRNRYSLDGFHVIDAQRSEALVEEMSGEPGSRPTSPGSAVLGWDELRRLAAEGVALAPHSRTHPLLDRLPRMEARREVLRSLDDLEREIGPTPRVFAYPGGGCDDEVAAVLKEEGFELGFLTRRGTNDLYRPDWLRLRRINVGRTTGVSLIRLQLLPWWT